MSRNEPLRELLIATSNEGKLHELHEILKDSPFVLVGLADYPHIQPVPETGFTFAENAAIKAIGYARQAQAITLADDSGLEIDALDGVPGVFSARYLGEGTAYAIRNRVLLEKLSSITSTERSARFVCAIAVADTEGRVLNLSTGTCEGRVAESSRGSGGFGYDPIFIPEGFDSTFGELSAPVKNQISHRARALAGALEFLRSLTERSHAG